MGKNKGIIYPDETQSLADNPRKTMDFNYNASTMTITDERDKITKQYYDLQGRVVKELKYNQNRNYLLEEIITEKYYDGLGNEVISIDPEDNRISKEYNSLNLLSRVNLPE